MLTARHLFNHAVRSLSSGWLLALSGILLLDGCAARQRLGRMPSSAVGRPQIVELEPIELTVHRDGRLEVLDALELFEAGGRSLEAGENARAVKQYDHLVARFADSKLVLPALYNAGLALERQRNFAEAARRYRALIDRAPESSNALDATFRLGGCYAELRQWRASAAAFASVQQRRDASAADYIEASTRQGLALFRLEQHDRARRAFQHALMLADRLAGIERLDDDFFVAMAQYYLAALSHVAFRQVVLQDGQQLGRQLDQKASHLIAAQAAYIKAIRLKHPYWATAAGFQIGSLYREFYDTLMTTRPSLASVARKHARQVKVSVAVAEQNLREAYFEQLHRRVRPLLEKAIRVFEQTVAIARRLRVDSRWVRQSRRQVTQLEQLLALSPEDAARKLREEPTPLPEDEPISAVPESPPAAGVSASQRSSALEVGQRPRRSL